MKKKEPELLRCPFCGSEAGFIYVKGIEERKFPIRWKVRCLNDDCHATTFYIHDTQEEAAAAWNRRA